MPTDVYDLDHIALAAADTAPLLRFLTGPCGATTLWGGQAIGFRPMQVWVGDADAGMKIELLEPWQPERNDFLERFVARHTHGPHHLTFKVPDIEAAIERFRGNGFRPTGIDLRDPEWMECFIVPKEAHGTVVQLAESRSESADEHEFPDRATMLTTLRERGATGTPRWWVDPEPPAGAPARLRHVVLRTPSLTSALGFFAGMLHGHITAETDERIELAWPGGAAIALELHPGAAPGVDRLELEGLDAAVEVLGTRFVPAG